MTGYQLCYKTKNIGVLNLSLKKKLIIHSQKSLETCLLESSVAISSQVCLPIGISAWELIFFDQHYLLAIHWFRGNSCEELWSRISYMYDSIPPDIKSKILFAMHLFLVNEVSNAIVVQFSSIWHLKNTSVTHFEHDTNSDVHWRFDETRITDLLSSCNFSYNGELRVNSK